MKSLLIIDYSSIGSLPRFNAHFGQGTGPILATYLYCTGSESSLLDCRSSLPGIASCQHYDDAGVVCLGMFSMRVSL